MSMYDWARRAGRCRGLVSRLILSGDDRCRDLGYELITHTVVVTAPVATIRSALVAAIRATPSAAVRVVPLDELTSAYNTAYLTIRHQCVKHLLEMTRVEAVGPGVERVQVELTKLTTLGELAKSPIPIAGKERLGQLSASLLRTILAIGVHLRGDVLRRRTALAAGLAHTVTSVRVVETSHIDYLLSRVA